METRQLKDLRGIGKRMMGDFQQLGIQSVAQLKTKDPQRLYDRMCELTGTRQDPCVLDTFRCAVEQARDPNLRRNEKTGGIGRGCVRARSNGSGKVGLLRLERSARPASPLPRSQ